jgi:hypothetical protein
MGVKQRIEGWWGTTDEEAPATVSPIRPENLPMPPGDLGNLLARAHELVGARFVIEETDDYPPFHSTAWRVNWELPSGEVPFLVGDPRLVFGLLDYLAAVAEAQTAKVVERPWHGKVGDS